jgi:DNA polymerase delta subunit 1
MGIVLKRRDNANIVKKIYGGIIDIILNKHDVKGSIKFLKDTLQDLILGKFPLEDMIITKTLKARYKDPDKIAHKVLAERIKERSPGSAPQANDRIPFAYVQVKSTNKEKILQGNRIEHPDYISEKKLKLDYEFYLTNQIMNPVLQLYALILEQLEGYKLPINHWKDIKKKLEDDGKSEKKVREKLADLRETEVKKLLFDPILLKLAHMKTGQTQITSFFKTS